LNGASSIGELNWRRHDFSALGRCVMPPGKNFAYAVK
jgi:hypothetical protein